MISAQWDLLFIRSTSRPGLPKATGQRLSCPPHNQYWVSGFGLESSLHLDISGISLVNLVLTYGSEWYRMHLLAFTRSKRAAMILRWQPLAHAQLWRGEDYTRFFLLDLRTNSRFNIPVLRTSPQDPTVFSLFLCLPISLFSRHTSIAQKPRVPPML